MKCLIISMPSFVLMFVYRLETSPVNKLHFFGKIIFSRMLIKEWVSLMIVG